MTHSHTLLDVLTRILKKLYILFLIIVGLGFAGCCLLRIAPVPCTPLALALLKKTSLPLDRFLITPPLLKVQWQGGSLIKLTSHGGAFLYKGQTYPLPDGSVLIDLSETLKHRRLAFSSLTLTHPEASPSFLKTIFLLISSLKRLSFQQTSTGYSFISQGDLFFFEGTYTPDHETVQGTLKVQNASSPQALTLTFTGQPLWIEETGQNQIICHAHASGHLSLADVLKIWPQEFLPDVFLWLKENLPHALIKEPEITLVLEGASGNLNHFYAAIPFTEGKLLFLEKMPPASAILGLCHITSSLLRIDFSKALLKDLALHTPSISQKAPASTLWITHLDQEDQTLFLRLFIKGSVASTLNLLCLPPLEIHKDFPLDRLKIYGDQSTLLRMAFPVTKTLAPNQIKLKAQSHLSQVRGSFSFFQNTPPLPFSHGFFDLLVTKKGFALQGPLFLGHFHPITLSWQQNFVVKKHQINVSAHWNDALITSFFETLAPSLACQFSFKDLPLTLKGETQILLYASSDTPTRLDVSCDKSTLSIPALLWTKPADAPLTLTLTHTSEKAPLSQERFSINLTLPEQKKISGQALWKDETLSSSLIFEGTTRTERITFSSLYASKTPLLTLDIKSPFCALPWLVPALKDLLAKESSSDFIPLHLTWNLKDVSLSPQQRLLDFSGDFSSVRDTEWLKVSGIIGESSSQGKQSFNKNSFSLIFSQRPFRIDNDPSSLWNLCVFSQELSSLFRLLAIPFGGQGQNFILKGKMPFDAPKALQATIEGLSLNNAPLLTRLFSFLPPPFGSFSFSNQGLHFDQAKILASLNKTSKGRHELILTQLSALGPSFGLNLWGKVDLSTTQLDLKGHLVPMALIQRLLSNIPLFGTILSGGHPESGIWSVGFSFKGAYEDPGSLRIDPLSLMPNLVEPFWDLLLSLAPQE